MFAGGRVVNHWVALNQLEEKITVTDSSIHISAACYLRENPIQPITHFHLKFYTYGLGCVRLVAEPFELPE